VSDKSNAAGMRVGAGFPSNPIPEFPSLPRALIERFPELRAYELAVKKWTEELTVVLRNTR